MGVMKANAEDIKLLKLECLAYKHWKVILNRLDDILVENNFIPKVNSEQSQFVCLCLLHQRRLMQNIAHVDKMLSYLNDEDYKLVKCVLIDRTPLVKACQQLHIKSYKNLPRKVNKLLREAIEKDMETMYE